MSFVLGNFTSGAALFTHSIDAELAFNISSKSGGREFLGTIPGLLEDVMKRKLNACIKSFTAFILSTIKCKQFYLQVLNCIPKL